MEGVSLVETATLNKLIRSVETLQEFVVKATEELASAKKPYMSVQEVMELTGFSEVWVCNNKQDIGYLNIGRTIRFKRKDVEEYMEANYFKSKSSRRKQS